MRWLVGWYAKRKHAVPEAVAEQSGNRTLRALCGAVVYLTPPTDWADRKAKSGVLPQCRTCLKCLHAEERALDKG